MRTAMIWGANGGIGRALTARLSHDGWTVLAVGRDEAGLTELTPHVYEADVADAYAVQQAVMLAAQEVEHIDLWVYAVGDILASRVDALELECWQRVMNANLTGAFLATHHSLPLLAEDAHLVFIGALNDRVRAPGLAAYASAKAGLQAFADSLSKEHRKKCITVVRPAAVATPLWDKVPIKLPSSAMTPDVLAEHIVDLYQRGHKGMLDLPG